MDDQRCALLSCRCPACQTANPVTVLASDSLLTCQACGRSFTLREALEPPSGEQVPAPVQPPQITHEATAPGSSRFIWWPLAGFIAVVVAIGAWAMQPGHTRELNALRAFCLPVAHTDASYPRTGMIIRNRAWVASSPSQPDGVALFTRLPEPRLDSAITIAGPRLRELLAPILGFAWHPRLSLWIDHRRIDELAPAGSSQKADVVAQRIPHVGMEAIAQHLNTGLGDALAARAVLDLLAGTPGRESPAIARRMLLQGDFPEQLTLVPFHGVDGTRLIDSGRPPYSTSKDSFSGLLLCCVGKGWPDEYRVLSLRAGKD